MRPLFWLMFCCCLLGREGAAQQYCVTARRYGPDEGLPHRQVNSLMQDRQGFIWTATNGGSRTVTLDKDLQVTNNLSLAGAGASFRMTSSPGGKKLKVNGNVSTEVFSWSSATNAPISLTGSANQTIQTVGSGSLIRLDVAKTGGNVQLPADVVLFTNGQLTGTGLLDNTGGVLRTLGNATFDFSGTIEDLRLAANSATVTLKKDVQVTNSLTLGRLLWQRRLDGLPDGEVLPLHVPENGLMPGWYVVVLRQEGRQATKKLTVR